MPCCSCHWHLWYPNTLENRPSSRVFCYWWARSLSCPLFLCPSLLLSLHAPSLPSPPLPTKPHPPTHCHLFRLMAHPCRPCDCLSPRLRTRSVWWTSRPHGEYAAWKSPGESSCTALLFPQPHYSIGVAVRCLYLVWLISLYAADLFYYNLCCPVIGIKRPNPKFAP